LECLPTGTQAEQKAATFCAPCATHEVRSERALSEQVGLYPRAANTRCSASVIQNVVTSTVADHIAILEEIQPSHK
jgi:hypothetical protein